MTETPKFNLISILLIALVSVGLYVNSLDNPFQFDDMPNIVDNPYLRDLSDWGSLWKGIRHRTGLFRALPTLSFAVDYRVHGLEVRGYHLVNLALHALSGILVYLLSGYLFRLGARGRDDSKGTQANLGSGGTGLFSLLTALIFVSHPIQVNTVTYIVQRNEGMASFFYLLSFLLSVKAILGRGKIRALCWAGAGISFLCSVFSKEIGLTLPAAVVLFDLIFVCKTRQEVWRRLRVYLPLLALLAAYLLFFFQGGMLRRFVNRPADWTWGPGENLLTQANVIVQYVKLLLLPCPAWLNVDHHFARSSSLLTYPTFLSAATILCLLVASLCLFRKSKIPCFSILFFFIVLSPTSSVIPLWDIMVEYRLYLPMFAYALCVSFALYSLHWAVTAHGLAKKILWGISILLLCFYGMVTLERNRVFGDPVRLWSDAARKSPNKLRPHYNLAMACAEKGRIEEAIREGEIAWGLRDQYYEKENVKHILNLLGAAHLAKGDREKAFRYLHQAMTIDPAFATPYYNLACLYAGEKDRERALDHLRKAVLRDPKYREKARKDKDLDPLRDDREFEAILK